ncbi:DUF1905 domain-containing protein [Streptomyces sp. AF1B]|uniref:DUF1905 domain-containing protein n=1 Tax=Streptomyces sp. AF1B TaxID=3399503 RepID=UPI003AB0D71A
MPGAQAGGAPRHRAVSTYGWGVIPVLSRIGDIDFETSLFPRDGGHLLPLKAAVRTLRQITVDDEAAIARLLAPDSTN